MKKWRCTVCGYIHTGDTPPDNCPVCGAPRDRFEPMDQTPAKKATKVASPASSEADVLVVGSGAAAFAAAISARSKGASVIMLEKAAHTGGTTARSGGGFWIPGNHHQQAAGIKDNKLDCLRYMARYSYPNLYQPDNATLGLPAREYAMLEAYWENASGMLKEFEELGALKSMMEINWTGKPQVDYMDHLPENKGIRGRTLYPKTAKGGMGMGVDLIAQLEHCAKSMGVTILTGHRATGIIIGDDGVATGLRVEASGGEMDFTAHGGIVFGSGGFSHNPELMLHFQRGPHYGGCAVPTNTGDLVYMAGTAGAALGNMAGAFRAQSMIEAALENPGGSSNLFYIAGDSVLIVNKYGRRIMDEKRNYTDRTMLHFVWDPQRAEWTNMLSFLIFDDRTASLWQNFPPYPAHGEQPSYLIRAHSWDTLTAELSRRLTTLSPHTGGFGLADDFAANLVNTVTRFNHFAANFTDEDFHRGEYAYDREWTTFPPTVPVDTWPESGSLNYTMHPLADTGPYYAIILAAGTLDTNGGPLTDYIGRILNWSGEPIPGLYGAGNCIASPTANAYWGAGSTIGPGLTFGYLAGADAARRSQQRG